MLKAKKLGFLTTIKPVVDKIRENGFFISDEIYTFVLEQAEELN